MRFPAQWLLAGVSVLFCGCGLGQSAPAKPLPAEYRVVAKHLARSILHAELEEFEAEDSQPLAAVLAEGHAAALDLANVSACDRIT